MDEKEKDQIVKRELREWYQQNVDQCKMEPTTLMVLNILIGRLLDSAGDLKLNCNPLYVGMRLKVKLLEELHLLLNAEQQAAQKCSKKIQLYDPNSYCSYSC